MANVCIQQTKSVIGSKIVKFNCVTTLWDYVFLSMSRYQITEFEKKNNKSRLHLSRQKRSLKRDFEKLTPFSEPFFDIGPLFICISSSIEFVVVIALNLIRFPHFKRFIVNDSFHRLKTLVTKVIEHIAWMKMCFESSDAS